jgi:hypothetical protein
MLDLNGHPRAIKSGFLASEIRHLIEIIKKLKTRHIPSIYQEFLKIYPNRRWDQTANLITVMKDKLKIGLMPWDEELYRILTKKGQTHIRNRKLVCEVEVDDDFALNIFYNTKQILQSSIKTDTTEVKK